ncbi:MAG: hypothetical protein QM571_06210 [Micrococcaceae bacterium]
MQIPKNTNEIPKEFWHFFDGITCRNWPNAEERPYYYQVMTRSYLEHLKMKNLIKKGTTGFTPEIVGKKTGVPIEQIEFLLYMDDHLYDVIDEDKTVDLTGTDEKSNRLYSDEHHARYYQLFYLKSKSLFILNVMLTSEILNCLELKIGMKKPTSLKWVNLNSFSTNSYQFLRSSLVESPATEL